MAHCCVQHEPIDSEGRRKHSPCLRKCNQELKEGWKDGRKEGRKEGREEGRKGGRKEGRKERIRVRRTTPEEMRNNAITRAIE